MDFFQQYGHFYYYNALDGHEADESTISLFRKYSMAINLHQDIQTKVVDIVYLSDNNHSLVHLDNGRISIDDAIHRITIILKAYDIDALLSQLA